LHEELYVLSEAAAEVAGAKLLFKRIDESLVELRASARWYELSLLISAKPTDAIALRPSAPRGGRVAVDCVLAKLEKPLVLVPGSSASASLRIPLDLEVAVNGHVAVSIPLARVKYALYGPPDLGVLCRYAGPELAREAEPQAFGELVAHFSSKARAPCTVAKVVLPLEGLGVYELEGGAVALSDVAVSVEDCSVAEVETSSGIPSAAGQRRVVYASEGRKRTFLMKFGLA